MTDQFQGIGSLICTHGLQAYGQTTYLITTMQRVPRGTEGAVSAEGTAAGAAAAVLFAGLAVLVGQVSEQPFNMQ